MSDSLGPVSYGDTGGDVFLGRDMMSRKDYSEKKAEAIDDEITNILKGLYDEAKQLLADHREVLDRVAEALLERETLETKDLALLLKGEPLPPVVMANVEPEPQGPGKAQPSKPERESDFPGENVPDPEPMPS